MIKLLTIFYLIIVRNKGITQGTEYDYRIRCDIKTARCAVEPDLVEIRPGHLVRCWEAK